MMRWLSILALCALVACHSDERLPDGVLPPAQMAPALKRVITADEYVGMRQEQAPLPDVNAERIHQYRAALHQSGVSEEQFRRSFVYYKDHPALLRTVLDTLQRQPNIDSAMAPTGLRKKAVTAPAGTLQ